MLSFNAEQKTRREIIYLRDARRPSGVILIRRQMLRLEISMSERNQPPDHSETQPGEQKARGENNERPPPLSVDQSGEDVLKEADAAPGTLGLENIALAVFENGAASDSSDCSRSKGFSGMQ